MRVRGRGMKQMRLSLVLVVVVCFLLLPRLALAQQPSWQGLKKAWQDARQQGDYPKAARLLKAAVGQAERTFDPEDPALAVALKELADAYAIGPGSSDSVEQLENLDQRILSIDEHNLGPRDPKVADDLVALAAVLSAKYWDDAKVLPLYERALSIYEDAGISDGARLLNLYSELGNRIYFNREYVKAENFYSRALAVFEGEPDEVCRQVWLRENLANTYIAEGRHRQAEQLYLDALADAQRSGHDSQCVQTRLQDLADFCAKHGQSDQAEATLLRALGLQQETYGPQDFHVALALDRLADFYRLHKSFDLALPVYERALGILERPGKTKTTVEWAMFGNELFTIGNSLRDQRRYDQAEAYYRRAETAYDRASPPQSHANSYIWGALGQLFVLQGKYDEAEDQLKKLLAWDERNAPPGSSTVFTDLMNLESEVYLPQQKYPEAEETIRREMAIGEKLYGPDSLQVADRLEALAGVLRRLARPDEADQAEARAKSIRRQR